MHSASFIFLMSVLVFITFGCGKANNADSSDSSSTPIDCPTGYIPVSGNTTLGASDDFCVMQFEAKAWDDASGNGDGEVDAGEIDSDGCNEASCSTANWGLANNLPASIEVGIPWRRINQTNAKAECESLGAGYDLISNPEWMTIARNIEAQAANWSGGSVGSGCLFRGNNGTADACGYDGASDTEPESGSGRDTKAKLTLSNGEEIWDFSGNVREWVDWTLGGALVRVIPANKAYATTGPKDYSIEFNTLNRKISNEDEMETITWQPLDTSLTSTNGIGQYYAGLNYSGGAAFRGGAWGGGLMAGVFSLRLSYPKTDTRNSTGFRCVYRP